MKPITIMVCDDDKTLQKLLQQKIEKFCADKNKSCRIGCCDSGEEMLALPAPDVLFLDIQMSGKNGMETARELRRRHENTILIFVTAMSEYVYEAFDVDALHYLIKPFSDEKLREVLDKALQQLRSPARMEEKILLVKQGGLSTKVSLSDNSYA